VRFNVDELLQYKATVKNPDKDKEPIFENPTEIPKYLNWDEKMPLCRTKIEN
jgi:hypothetical protein